MGLTRSILATAIAAALIGDSTQPLIPVEGGGGGGVTCAYPLDDDGTLATAFNLTLLPLDAPGYQTFTHTTLADGTIFIALPASVSGAAALPRPATSPVAVQYMLTAAELPVRPGETAVNAVYGGPMIIILSNVGAPVGYANIQLYGYDAVTAGITGFTGFARLNVNDTDVADINITSAIAGVSVAFYVNADGTVGYTVAGGDEGTIAGLTVGATDTFVFCLRLNDYGGGAYATAGIDFSGELLTSAADITEPVPAGATDPCGNVIG